MWGTQPERWMVVTPPLGTPLFTWGHYSSEVRSLFLVRKKNDVSHSNSFLIPQYWSNLFFEPQKFAQTKQKKIKKISKYFFENLSWLSNNALKIKEKRTKKSCFFHLPTISFLISLPPLPHLFKVALIILFSYRNQFHQFLIYKNNKKALDTISHLHGLNYIHTNSIATRLYTIYTHFFYQCGFVLGTTYKI